MANLYQGATDVKKRAWHIPRIPYIDSPEGEAELRALWLAGETVRAIAQRLGVTVYVVGVKAHELGLRERRSRGWPLADDETLARLHAEGLAMKAIASRLGRTLGATSSRCRKLGLRRRVNSLTRVVL